MRRISRPVAAVAAFLCLAWPATAIPVAAAAMVPGPAAGPSPAVDAARAPDPQPGWIAPLAGDPATLDIRGGFDPPAQDWLPGHRGVDLGAPPGASVRAPADGIVTFAGPVAGRGVLVLTHDNGLRSSFEPVIGTVAVGTRIAAGTAVATLDATAGHCAPESCLHWGVRDGERYVDPLGLLGLWPPIVLLPLPQ